MLTRKKNTKLKKENVSLRGRNLLLAPLLATWKKNKTAHLALDRLKRQTEDKVRSHCGIVVGLIVNLLTAYLRVSLFYRKKFQKQC